MANDHKDDLDNLGNRDEELDGGLDEGLDDGLGDLDDFENEIDDQDIKGLEDLEDDDLDGDDPGQSTSAYGEEVDEAGDDYLSDLEGELEEEADEERPEKKRSGGRGKLIAGVGALGLVMILGGGSVLVSSMMSSPSPTTAQSPDALDPQGDGGEAPMGGGEIADESGDDGSGSPDLSGDALDSMVAERGQSGDDEREAREAEEAPADREAQEESTESQAEVAGESPRAPAIDEERLRSIISDGIRDGVDEAVSRVERERPEDSGASAADGELIERMRETMASFDEGMGSLGDEMQRVNDSLANIDRSLSEQQALIEERFEGLDDRLAELESRDEDQEDEADPGEAESAEADAREGEGDSEGVVPSDRGAVASVSPDYYKHLIGRMRLKGFQVVNTTGDGSMSVVTTPSDRVNVYFEGERFRIPGAVVTVSDILADGRLVLGEDDRGRQWFIDGILDEREDEASRSAPRERQVAADSSGDEADSEGPSKTSDWTLHAVLSDGYLIRNDDGMFLSVSRGDDVEGVGEVSGMDSDGRLQVGDRLIAPAE